jgi:hypothetical protein
VKLENLEVLPGETPIGDSVGFLKGGDRYELDYSGVGGKKQMRGWNRPYRLNYQ